ncbi:MAG TPA: L,D-transpeptidase [Solirubrobacterales bacterium]|nr:L,D-transpeptidase [Solirubrobacterales bacterium]
MSRRRLSSLLAAACVLALPASAAAAPAKKPAPQPTPAPGATVKVKVGHLDNGRAEIMQKVPVTGTLAPFVAGQEVKVTFYLDGKILFSRNLPVSKAGGKGSFRTSIEVRENGKYAVAAKHVATPELGADETVRKSWKVSFPSLHEGQCGDVVVGFKKAMRKMGYIANSGNCFGGKTARGVLAYRKVNGMSRSMRAGAGLVKKAFSGRGGYEVRHPGAGEHVEAPLSKQVLVFAKGDKAFAIYPISSGKSSTPTVTGHYEFIRQEPGYNSHGMYYSFYFYGGYAVHGYESVPDYPASHGCLRTFIADQPEIYERIFFGKDIFIW